MPVPIKPLVLFYQRLIDSFQKSMKKSNKLDDDTTGKAPGFLSFLQIFGYFGSITFCLNDLVMVMSCTLYYETKCMMLFTVTRPFNNVVITENMDLRICLLLPCPENGTMKAKVVKEL